MKQSLTVEAYTRIPQRVIGLKMRVRYGISIVLVLAYLYNEFEDMKVFKRDRKERSLSVFRVCVLPC